MYYSNMNIEHHIMETQAFLRPCRVIIASCADWIIGYNQQYFVKSRAHGMDGRESNGENEKLLRFVSLESGNHQYAEIHPTIFKP